MNDLPIVEVGPVAHGGHCVARLDGRVVFVRHTLPGETVRISITERSKSFWRADAVEVIEASPDRVVPPCKYAGVCGGCDFQHVSVAGQARLLTSVVREQLQRLAKIDWDGEVEVVDPPVDWRTRVQWAIADNGLPGLRKHRSHEVVVIDDCVIAHPDLPTVQDRLWDAESVEARVTSTGQQVVSADRALVSGPEVATEEVNGERFAVGSRGFWQVHPHAARVLVDAVTAGADVRPGDRVLDLYGGVGLFAKFLTGEGREVVTVEGNREASRHAARNLRGVGSAVHGDVAKLLARGVLGTSADVVVLDPPRTGAKGAVPAIAALGARRIVYVACDPAALARDLGTFAEHGYALESLRGFALFPMTSHVEVVALLSKGS